MPRKGKAYDQRKKAAIQSAAKRRSGNTSSGSSDSGVTTPRNDSRPSSQGSVSFGENADSLGQRSLPITPNKRSRESMSSSDDSSTRPTPEKTKKNDTPLAVPSTSARLPCPPEASHGLRTFSLPQTPSKRRHDDDTSSQGSSNGRTPEKSQKVETNITPRGSQNVVENRTPVTTPVRRNLARMRLDSSSSGTSDEGSIGRRGRSGGITPVPEPPVKAPSNRKPPCRRAMLPQFHEVQSVPKKQQPPKNRPSVDAATQVKKPQGKTRTDSGSSSTSFEAVPLRRGRSASSSTRSVSTPTKDMPGHATNSTLPKGTHRRSKPAGARNDSREDRPHGLLSFAPILLAATAVLAVSTLNTTSNGGAVDQPLLLPAVQHQLPFAASSAHHGEEIQRELPMDISGSISTINNRDRPPALIPPDTCPVPSTTRSVWAIASPTHLASNQATQPQEEPMDQDVQTEPVLPPVGLAQRYRDAGLDVQPVMFEGTAPDAQTPGQTSHVQTTGKRKQKRKNVVAPCEKEPVFEDEPPPPPPVFRLPVGIVINEDTDTTTPGVPVEEDEETPVFYDPVKDRRRLKETQGDDETGATASRDVQQLDVQTRHQEENAAHEASVLKARQEHILELKRVLHFARIAYEKPREKEELQAVADRINLEDYIESRPVARLRQIMLYAEGKLSDYIGGASLNERDPDMARIASIEDDRVRDEVARVAANIQQGPELQEDGETVVHANPGQDVGPPQALSQEEQDELDDLMMQDIGEEQFRFLQQQAYQAHARVIPLPADPPILAVPEHDDPEAVDDEFDAEHAENFDPFPAADHANVEPFRLGRMNRRCTACQALHFGVEPRSAEGTYMACCNHGQVHYPTISRGFRWLPTLQGLLDGSDPRSDHFQKRITRYNAMFAMVSFHTTQRLNPALLNPRVLLFAGMPQHAMHAAYAGENQRPRANQIFFLEPEERDRVRHGFNDVRPDIIADLMHEFRNNQLMRNFELMGQRLREDRRDAEGRGQRLTCVALTIVPPDEVADPREPHRRNAAPTAAYEVAVLFEGNEPPVRRHIRVYPHNGGPYTLHHGTPELDAMTYPIAHPEGDPGFVYNTPLRPWGARGGRGRGNGRRGHRQTVARRQHAAYRLSMRHSQFDGVLRCGRLTQQLTCDYFMRIEQDRVNDVRRRQEEMFAVPRQGLLAHLERRADEEGVGVGRLVHFPRSFEGGPACMQARYLDAMATVRKFGKPDLFLTMTCNPAWPEIQDNLYPGLQWPDHPSLVCRVFYEKLMHMVRSIEDGTVFGPCLGVIMSVEFQKRGLPHAHMLVFLRQKIRSAAQVDSIISGEIPDPIAEPELYRIVTQKMLHNLCGQGLHGTPCMQGRRNCAKGYPKPWAQFTRMDDGRGRVELRRRMGPAPAIVRGKTYTHRSVVSYSPYLLKRYDCHLNVDVVVTLRSLKYIFKYIFKGADALQIRTQAVQEGQLVNEPLMQEQPQPGRAIPEDPQPEALPHPTLRVHLRAPDNNAAENPTVQHGHVEMQQNEVLAPRLPMPDPQGNPLDYPVRPDLAGAEDYDPAPPLPRRLLDYDETIMYYNTRYVSSMEAAWRIMRFPMHHSTIPVQTLVVHDEGQGYVYFRKGQEHEAAIRNRKLSTLEGYMLLNAGPHRDLAMQYPYERVAEMFTHDRVTGHWNVRVQGHRMHRVIGRLAAVPLNSDRYFIRLLLRTQVGFRSFEELRTVRGVLYDTYREACVALGLLQNDDEHRLALEEACVSMFPRALRRLLVHMTVFCGVLDPQALFEACEASLIYDYIRRGRDEQVARMMALRNIARLFDRLGARPDQWQELLDIDLQELVPAEILDEELPQLPPQQVQRIVDGLNDEQRVFFDIVIDRVTRRMAPDTTMAGMQNMFFLRGAGGTGKTYLYTAICNRLRELGKTFKCVAWTGVASQLLPGGSTSHYTFGLPFDLTAPGASSSLMMDSTRANYLRSAHLIIWDEVSMVHREALVIVDRLLQAVMGNHLPFGGKLIVVGGDFHQLLPVVTGQNAATLSALASPCYSPLWPEFVMHTLTRNRRAQRDPEFAAYLLTLARGRTGHALRPHTTNVQLPPRVMVDTVQQLLDNVFRGDVLINGAHSAILSPKNQDCLELNDEIVESRVHGAHEDLYSLDEVTGLTEGMEGLMPLDLVHSLTPSGLPQHRLRLKQGVVVVLLRNIDVSMGLCNGARMVVRTISDNVLGCEMLTGEHAGEPVYLPRLQFDAAGSDVPVAFSRRQFPVRIGYVVTINRAQGQTYERVGVLLKNPVFSHGHLYVALSRVATYNHLFILNTASRDPTTTVNIVNQGVLRVASQLREVDDLPVPMPRDHQRRDRPPPPPE